jgi:uncharacterized protein (TIGR00730 family)
MTTRPRRHRTGNPALDKRIADLLDAAGTEENRDQLLEILASAVGLATDGADRLDLKITNAALKEMREAFRVFSPYRDVPKVTIFGSARTLPDDPLYSQTRDFGAAAAAAGWMVVTGAGPGIMAAGTEGAGPERSIGVNIRLPFEQANRLLDSDPKLVLMKYFFTRKLMLMKESAGFAVLPGGFGTQDETFELLTLLQTGKATPAPIVLLDVPGGTYWRNWQRFIDHEIIARGLASRDDMLLCRITDDVGTALEEILGFYRNYHSIRFVGRRLVLRLRAAPTTDELAMLNLQFSDTCVSGRIGLVDPLPPEVAENDHLDLPRLAFEFDRMSYGRLRALIDTVNNLLSAPPLALPDRDSFESAATAPGLESG